jgi:Concanavalin A-like lectin/glucanases superfamily
LYKNGVQKDIDSFDADASFPIPDGDIRTGDAPVRLGSHNGRSYFRGAIADVYFYDRLLDDQEIIGLYLDAPRP